MSDFVDDDELSFLNDTYKKAKGNPGFWSESVKESQVEASFESDESTIHEIFNEPATKRTLLVLVVALPTMLISVIATVLYLSHTYPIQSLQDVNTRFASYDSQLRILSNKQKRVNSELSQATPLLYTLEKRLGDIEVDLSQRQETLEASLSKSVKEQVQISHELERMTKQLRATQLKLNKVSDDTGTLETLLKATEGGNSESLSQVWTRFSALQDKFDGLVGDVKRKLEELESEKHSIPDLEDIINKQVLAILEQHPQDNSEFAAKLELEVKTKMQEELLRLRSELQPQLDESELSRIVARVVRQEMKRGAPLQHISNYASSAAGAKINAKETHVVRRPRKRTTVVERIAWGWYDFLKRHTVGDAVYDPLGLGNVYSRKNSPANVLSDGVWQVPASLSFDKFSIGIRLAQPVQLSQIELCHPGISPSTAPKHISVFAKPERSHRSLEKLSMEVFRTASTHPDYVKFAEFEYRQEAGRCQRFEVPTTLKNAEVGVTDLLVLIESNWGSDSLTVIGGIRVYGGNPKRGVIHSFKKMVNAEGDALGADTPF